MPVAGLLNNIGQTYMCKPQRRFWAGAMLSAVTMIGCGNVDSPSGNSDSAFPNPGPQPSDIKVHSATVFSFEGQKCKLLGVSESEDADVRKRAMQFTTTWFDSIGNYIGVYNASNPLRLEDGTNVVWIRGYDSYLSCLNVELARAGLVELDYESFKDYSFTEPTKEGEEVATWRGDLDAAKQGHEGGEKPKVLFDWPPGE
jgi:hypothetical protein